MLVQLLQNESSLSPSYNSSTLLLYSPLTRPPSVALNTEKGSVMENNVTGVTVAVVTHTVAMVTRLSHVELLKSQ